MTKTRVRIVPGYGDSIRRQLEQMGWKQTELASRAGVSRQTISRALNHDEVSDKTAELIAAALGQVADRPSPRRSARAAPDTRTKNEPPRPTGGALCAATDLVAWADRREAQALLPKVVRRLVLVTGNKVMEAQFRADEGVQLSGWDGVVRAEESAPFVPAGSSGWEMGVGLRPKDKADDDLEKRTAEGGVIQPAEASFMFVTLRRWPDKDDWSYEKTEAGPWRRVRVLDADDVASWLETAPAVHAWLSILIGKTPPGVVDLESFWDTWSRATHPALSPLLLLAGREEAAAQIRDRVVEAQQPFAIRSESRQESIAMLFASLQELPPEEAEAVLARAVVVESADALRHLTASSSPLLLIPSFDAEALASAAARAGHTVVVPLGAGDPKPESAVEVPPVFRRTAADVLRELGIEDDRAYKMAGLARRSFTAFRRAVATSPGLRQPGWANPAVGRSLLPALLTGSWNGGNPRDREILAALGRRPYEETIDQLIEWSVGADPAVRRRGDTWYLVSREDAWKLLGKYITSDDLQRFEQIALRVLGAIHPAFDLPADQRWMAGALGHSAEYSGLLARGLAETLAIMGARGEGIPSAGISSRDAAESVVRELLEAANQDWRVWASLSQYLPLLAESAPDAFLDGVEEGLSAEQPVLGRLFADESGGLFGSSLHTGLLWALEALAWSPLHLGRVVPLLAGLDRIDPGSELRAEGNSTGRLSNRPLASLKAIFRTWLPETSALLDERLVALDRLRVGHNDVAWAVMLSMLPENRAAAFPSAKPSFRDWAVDARGTMTYGEIARTAGEVGSRLREDAAEHGARWAALIERLSLLPPDEHEAVVVGLQTLSRDAVDVDERTAIWSELRELVGRHRAHRSANWAMPEERLERLENLAALFAPDDPAVLYGWLFGYHPDLPDGDDAHETSWKAREERVRSERVKAVELMMPRDGIAALESLADQVEDPFGLGVAAGSSDAAIAQTDDLLRLLATAVPSRASLAIGFATGRRRAEGDEWVERQLQRADLALSPDQEAALLQVLPATTETWECVRERGEPTRLAYWRTIGVHTISSEDVSEAIQELIEVGRRLAAVDLLWLNSRGNGKASPELVAKVLEAATSADGRYEEPSNHFAYSVGELLDRLHESGFDQATLAGLEWAFLPVLERFDRRPKALDKLLSDSPDFFIEVLSLVYRAEGEESVDLSDEDQHRARMAFRLMHDWRRIPGQQDDGTVDSDQLREWITATVERLEEVGRRTIGLQVIGQVLSGSPADPDGSWPSTAVREIIETLASKDLEEGFRIGVVNSRGVVTRDPAAGGAQERALAEEYDGLAAVVSTTFPRTARTLRLIADGYRRDARRQDFESEIGEDLGV